MTRPSPRMVALALLACLGTIPSCLVNRAAAQDDRFARVLLIVTVHEAGVDSLADATGIHAALVHGAERHGMTPVAFSHAYSPRLWAGTTRRPWVLALRLDCRRPAAFAGRWNEPRASGSTRRDACLALVAHVRELVAGEPRCTATDWAAPYVPLGAWLVAADCGAARNAFARRVR